MELFLSYILPSLGALLALGMVRVAKMDLAPPENQRITLLIAHPDDEAMFFAPTVLALAKTSLKNRVQILCLSSGEVDTLRETRQKELYESASILGLTSPDQVTVLDDVRFPDSMTRKWPAQDIVNVLSKKLGSSSAGKKGGVDILITFDAHGISSHPNHISLYHGARQWAQKQKVAGSHLTLYSLTTTNILRKYISIIDVPITMVLRAIGKRSERTPGRLVFINGAQNYQKAQKAMTSGHVSQMLWFRWAWIGLSRYMHVNDLVEQKGFQHAAEEAALWLGK